MPFPSPRPKRWTGMARPPSPPRARPPPPPPPPCVTLASFEAPRGGVLAFTVTALAAAPRVTHVRFGDRAATDTSSATADSFKVSVPPTLPLGRYTVRVD